MNGVYLYFVNKNNLDGRYWDFKKTTKRSVNGTMWDTDKMLVTSIFSQCFLPLHYESQTMSNISLVFRNSLDVLKNWYGVDVLTSLFNIWLSCGLSEMTKKKL